MKININININLKESYSNLLKKKMQNLNFKFSDTEEIINQYLNVVRKVNIPKVKDVYINPQMFLFYRYEKEINEIRENILKNKNISKRLSCESINAKKRDRLLDHFNIYHFHLGSEVHSMNSKFISRTGDLLYVYFDVLTENAYILGVYPHGDWLENKWFKILYSHWPKMCEQYKLNGVNGLSKDAGEVAQFRRANVNVPVCIEGRVYIPPQCVITMSGIRKEDQESKDQILHRLSYIEEDLLKNFEKILPRNIYDIFLTYSNLYFEIDSIFLEAVYIKEIQTGIILKLKG